MRGARSVYLCFAPFPPSLPQGRRAAHSRPQGPTSTLHAALPALTPGGAASHGRRLNAQLTLQTRLQPPQAPVVLPNAICQAINAPFTLRPRASRSVRSRFPPFRGTALLGACPYHGRRAVPSACGGPVPPCPPADPSSARFISELTAPVDFPGCPHPSDRGSGACPPPRPFELPAAFRLSGAPAYPHSLIFRASAFGAHALRGTGPGPDSRVIPGAFAPAPPFSGPLLPHALAPPGSSHEISVRRRRLTRFP